MQSLIMNDLDTRKQNFREIKQRLIERDQEVKVQQLIGASILGSTVNRLIDTEDFVAVKFLTDIWVEHFHPLNLFSPYTLANLQDTVHVTGVLD